MQIEIENLTFTYPDAAKPAIRNVSLSLESGSFTCVCGRSGCGKTTLIRHLKSALAPHGQREGNVLIDGTPLTEIPTRRQAGLIGFVMQRPSAQIVTDSALDELSFGLESIGASPLTTKLRVAEMASFFGMQDWLHESVHRLSGGQQQLLNIAATMTMEPEALVLDEPTSQLDPISATKLMDALRRVNIDLGTTIIIVEHDLENVLTMADKLVAMGRGCGARKASQGCQRAICQRGRDSTNAPLSRAHLLRGRTQRRRRRDGRGSAERSRRQGMA